MAAQDSKAVVPVGDKRIEVKTKELRHKVSSEHVAADVRPATAAAMAITHTSAVSDSGEDDQDRPFRFPDLPTERRSKVFEEEIHEFSHKIAATYGLDPDVHHDLIMAPHTSTVLKRSHANMRLKYNREVANECRPSPFTVALVKKRAVTGTHNKIVNILCLLPSPTWWSKQFEAEVRSVVNTLAYKAAKAGHKSVLIAEVPNFNMQYLNDILLQGFDEVHSDTSTSLIKKTPTPNSKHKSTKDKIKDNEIELKIIFSITDPSDITPKSIESLREHLQILEDHFGYIAEDGEGENWDAMFTPCADDSVQVAGGIYHRVGRIYEDSEHVIRALADECYDFQHFVLLFETWARDHELTDLK